MRLLRRGAPASTLDLLVAGLGNPGREYARTRHNIGHMVCDELARRHGGSYRSKFSGDLAELRLDGVAHRAAEAADVHERVGAVGGRRGPLLQASAGAVCSWSTTRSTSSSGASRRGSEAGWPATTASARSRSTWGRPSSCGSGSASAAPSAAIPAPSPTGCSPRSRLRSTSRRLVARAADAVETIVPRRARGGAAALQRAGVDAAERVGTDPARFGASSVRGRRVG